MKIQRGQITDNNGELIEVICEVSDPHNPEVIMSFHRSWNNSIMAQQIFEIISKALK